MLGAIAKKINIDITNAIAAIIKLITEIIISIIETYSLSPLHAAMALLFISFIMLRMPSHIETSVNTSTILPWSVKGGS